MSLKVELLSECQTAKIRVRRSHPDPSCLHMTLWLCLVG